MAELVTTNTWMYYIQKRLEALKIKASGVCDGSMTIVTKVLNLSDLVYPQVYPQPVENFSTTCGKVVCLR